MNGVPRDKTSFHSRFETYQQRKILRQQVETITSAIAQVDLHAYYLVRYLLTLWIQTVLHDSPLKKFTNLR